MLRWRESNLYIRSFLLRPLAGLCICTHRIDMCGGGIKTSGTKMAPPLNCAANTAGAPKKLRCFHLTCRPPYTSNAYQVRIQKLHSDSQQSSRQKTLLVAAARPLNELEEAEPPARETEICERSKATWDHISFGPPYLLSPSQSDSPSCRCSWKTYSMMKMAMKNDASPSWLSLVTIHPKPKW